MYQRFTLPAQGSIVANHNPIPDLTTLQLTQGSNRALGIILRILDQPTNCPKMRILRIPKQLKQHTLAGRNHGALTRKPRERNGPLELVAARHAVREHVDLVPAPQQVEGRLRHADVRLDAHDDHGQLVVRGRRADHVGHFRNDHAEDCFVNFGQGRRLGREERGDFRDGGTESRGVLRGGDYGHVED